MFNKLLQMLRPGQQGPAKQPQQPSRLVGGPAQTNMPILQPAPSKMPSEINREDLMAERQPPKAGINIPKPPPEFISKYPKNPNQPAPKPFDPNLLKKRPM